MTSTQPTAANPVLVLGGDGTFCGQPSWPATPASPVLGVNLAASAFWPRPRREAIDAVLEHVAAQGYRVEDRLTLDVVVRQGGRINRGWALNEVSLEKGPRPGVFGGRLTVGRCRRLAATGALTTRPIKRRGALGGRPSCGRPKRSWWSPSTLTRCFAGQWSPAPKPPSPSK